MNQNRAQKTYNLIGFSLLAYLVISQIGYVLVYALPEWLKAPVGLVCMLFSFLPPVAILIRGKWIPFLKNAVKRPRVPVYLLAPLFLGVVLLANYLVSLLKPVSAQLPESFSGKLVYIVSSCVVAPVLEECLFRGAIQGRLRRTGPWFAILVSSVLFTLAHSVFLDLPVVFLLSVLLGYAVEVTRSLLSSIVLHALNNLFAVLLLLARAWRGGVALSVYFLFAFLILPVLIVAAVLLLKNQGYLPALRVLKKPAPAGSLKTLFTAKMFAVSFAALTVAFVINLIL